MNPESILKAWKRLIAEERLPFTAMALVFGLILLPLARPSNYLLHIAVLVFVYVTLGLGLNIVVGFAGLLDLGYVAFYAVGAYSYALLSLHYQIPFLVALLIGAGLAASLGIVLGWPTIRTRGDYLALVTLGFGEMIRLLLRNWDSLTNGPRGLMDVPPPSLVGFTFSTPTRFYYLGLVLGVCALAVSWKVKYSAVGQQLAAIRDDEDAAAAIGINPARWKLYAFALGAFIAGLAGVFFASWQQFVSPESFTLGESILVLSIVVLGGMGRLWPTLGAAAFLVLLPEALRGLETYRILVLGVLLVVVVVLQERWRLLLLNKRQNVMGHDQGLAVTRFSPPDIGPRFRTSTPGEPLLSVSNLSKYFGGVRALESVSLVVNRGEIVGLVGANGAGKTTLLSCMSGVLHTDTGEIHLHKENNLLALTGLTPFQAAREGVVRTFQQPRLFESMSPLANVELGERCRDTPGFFEPFVRLRRVGSPTRNFGIQLLRSVGIATPVASIAGMSFVDRKMTELARAISTEPELLLVDEPASGMEPAARLRLSQAIRWANESLGIAIVVVEHDLGFLRSLCHRIIVIDRGKVVADGAPHEGAVRAAIKRTYEAPRSTDAVA